MRVLIDTSYAHRGPSGTGVYVEQLIRALRRRVELEVVEAVQPRRARPGGANRARSGVNAAIDADWLHRGLAVAARRARADVVHHPLPAHSRGVRCAQVSTFHDVAFASMPAGYGRVWRALALRAYRRAAAANDAIVAVSEQTRAEVTALLGAEPRRLVVAPHGPGQAEGAEPAGGERIHLLYVGDSQQRKHLGLLLEAHAAYRKAAAEPVDLVIAGARELPGEPPDGVRTAFRPSREELLDLYGTAIALVHPSRHEGFGLTVLEAMALGTPVIAIRSAATEALAADAALLVSDSGEMADAMGRLVADAGLRDELAQRGRESARRYSWDASARAHLQAYTLALG